MPEGDTIHRTAARLRQVLDAKQLVRFDAPRLVGDRPLVGDTITSVEAVGKSLLISFDTGLVLHTHMKMTGAWHMYRSGERWQKGAHLMRALLDVGEWVAVCFAAPVVETYHVAASAPSPVSHLGPDLCVHAADIETAVARMASQVDASCSLADALLDQRIACGIGNVYKSEALWACRLSPFATVGSLDDSTRTALLATAAKQLRSNLNTTSRTTVPGGLAVYGRRGKPCRRCETPVQMQQFGVQPRSTYWCPTCQSSPNPERV